MDTTYNDENSMEYRVSSGNHLSEQGESMYNENVTNENNKPRRKPGRKRSKKKRQAKLSQQSINFEPSLRIPAGIHPEQDFGDSFEEPKRDGFIRIAGCNVDNFTTSNFNNEKGNLVRAFIRRYELDGLWGQEAGLNWDLDALLR